MSIFLFIASLESLAQSSPLRTIPFRYLVLQTIDIMHQFDISPRQCLDRDTPFIKYQVLADTGHVIAFFGAEQTHFFRDSSKRFRYYTNPLLVLSQNVDSILRYSSDTTSIIFINAQSAIIHELVHYLQGPYDEPLPFPTNEAQFTEYYKLRSEQEAFITAACFFVRKFKPATFREIMDSNKSLRSKIVSLLNYLFRTIGYNVFWRSAAD